MLAAGLLALAACRSEQGGDPARARDSAHSPAAAATSTTRPSVDWTVRLDGVGPVRYGMSLAEARAALGDSLAGVPPGDGCEYTMPASAPLGVSFMFENGRLVRVDVDSAGVRTAAGAEVGMTEAEIRARYPTGLEIRPHKYDDAGHYLMYAGPQGTDSTLRLVFETDGERVRRFRAGVRPAVEYVEGCA